MSDDPNIQRWHRARTLFERCVELDRAARRALLDAECGDDAELRREIESLLAADEAAIDAPTVPGLSASSDLVDALVADRVDVDERRWLGLRIGAFQIERVLGRGGMGTVFLANRVDGEYAQQVAIKLIRQGFGSSSLHARLRAERQILASLAHPRIARLLDGGVAGDGTPYIVMEYVDGSNLLDYARREHLTLNARLELFLSLLDAVEYAHQRLVVHRDIKPSNILVDRDGRAKLLDFGVAKLLATDASTTASVGAAPFTPAYAAPEQIRGEAVTTAIDIYALGLVLYEVLTGARPYKVEDSSSPRAYEIAVLEQTPTRPSDAVRADNEIDAAAVRKALRGDLDAIVLKALRKEPIQRYASVADFASDIRSHLAQRPVAARQGNFRYVAGRFVRRHAFALGLIAVALGAIIAAAVIAELQRRDAVAARVHAEAEAARASAVTDFMVEVFENADPLGPNGSDVTARAVFERARERIDVSLKEPTARAELLLALARAMSGVSPVYRLTELTEEAVAIRRTQNDPRQLAHAIVFHAMALVRDGRDADAIAAANEVERLLGAADDSDAQWTRFRARRWQATALMNSHKAADAVVVFAAMLAQLPPGIEPLGELSVDVRNRYGYALIQSHRAVEARAVLAPLADALRKSDPPRRGELSTVLHNLAWAWPRFDQLAQAEALMREGMQIEAELVDHDPRALMGERQNIAWLLKNQGKHVAALRELTEALAAVAALDDDKIDPTRLVPLRRQQAEIEWLLGHPERAVAIVAPEVEVMRARVGETARIGAPLVTLAAAQIDTGDFDAAAATLANAERVLATSIGTQSRMAMLVERTRLALLRGQSPDCAAIADEEKRVRADPIEYATSNEHYLFAYAALCRLSQVQDDASARAELQLSIEWFQAQMPNTDTRTRGLIALQARLASTHTGKR